MSVDSDDRLNLLVHALVPVADEEDARTTVTALEPYRPDHVTVVHVAEKGEGVPDKTPVEQSEELAAAAFSAVRTVFPDADDHIAYARDVAGAILDTADRIGASAIVYCPRGGSRLVKILSGDVSSKLIANAECPVVVLPREDPNR